MIRHCHPGELETIAHVINDGAAAYRGVVPADCLADPYFSLEELRHELSAGVQFWGFEEDGILAGVMGLQRIDHPVRSVTLVRHAYVRRRYQNLGIGSRLLAHLRVTTALPILIGAWAEASWAIAFYERHGFVAVPSDQKDELLQRYWTVPERQRKHSVVLADSRWFLGSALGGKVTPM